MTEPRWDYAKAVSLGWIPKEINDDVKRQEISLCEGVYQVYSSSDVDSGSGNLREQTEISVSTVAGVILVLVLVSAGLLYHFFTSKMAAGYSVITAGNADPSAAPKHEQQYSRVQLKEMPLFINKA